MRKVKEIPFRARDEPANKNAPALSKDICHRNIGQSLCISERRKLIIAKALRYGNTPFLRKESYIYVYF